MYQTSVCPGRGIAATVAGRHVTAHSPITLGRSRPTLAISRAHYVRNWPVFEHDPLKLRVGMIAKPSHGASDECHKLY